MDMSADDRRKYLEFVERESAKQKKTLHIENAKLANIERAACISAQLAISVVFTLGLSLQGD